MNVSVKTPREIALMREAGKNLALAHEYVEKNISPGMSTMDVNELADDYIRSRGCVPNFLNYEGFPATACVSLNDEVVHGIPKSDRKLMEGDIVSIDMGLIYEGYHSDAARTYGVGHISREAELLIERTRNSFFEGIRYARAGRHLHDISRAIAGYASHYHYGVVRDLTGHGIGTHLHEDPPIPNNFKLTPGIKLLPGMTLAIEPMITLGTWRVVWLDDDWTVVTADGSLSAHYENTVLITDGEPEILTLIN